MLRTHCDACMPEMNEQTCDVNNVSGGAGPDQHDWGAGGQRLVGEILDDVVLPHQFEDPRQLAG